MLAKKLLTKAIAMRTQWAIALTLFQLSACVNSSKITTDRGYLVSTAEITENPNSFIGQSVFVRNDVIATIGNRGLILDKDSVFSGEAILVINSSNTSVAFSASQTPEILVYGTVERFNLSNIAQKYGLNLDRDLYTQYKSQPVIIASSLILSPDPEDLSDRPEMYYDKPLAIKGEVEDVKYQYGVFELDEERAFGGEDLLVVQVKPKIQLYEEQTVLVFGTLRPFIPNKFERDYNLDRDSLIHLENEYSQKPVLVAEKIQILR